MSYLIYVINGPNLNLLGQREPELYGGKTLRDVEKSCIETAKKYNAKLKFFQSNAEHDIVEQVQQGGADGVDFILLNPGAFTHTSVAIRDALLAVGIPFIEIHLSNVFAREDFRHSSYFSDIAAGCIFGLGAYGYEIALQAASRQLSEEK